MGTSAVVRIFEGDREILAMYAQSDGYPEGPHGFGYRVKAFCESKTLTNGIRSYESTDTANGAGCLAAQLVAHFKERVGGFYIVAPGDNQGMQYEYHVRCPEPYGSSNMVTIERGGKIKFEAFECSGGFGGKRSTKRKIEVTCESEATS